MAQDSAARFFKAIQEDQAFKAKLKAITDPDAFVKLAEENGYQFTTEELQNQIERMSPEEVASVINPGIGPRRHLVPR